MSNVRFLAPDAKYDVGGYDRELVIKRYLRLVNSADYRQAPPIESDVLHFKAPVEEIPPNLITTGKRITPAVKRKILGALLISPLPKNRQMSVMALFHQTKFFGYRYNYKLQIWEAS